MTNEKSVKPISLVEKYILSEEIVVCIGQD